MAALELGYTSVQNIAKRADISRPTAYEVIKALIRRGLMKEIKRKGSVKGERSFFAAESPDNLLGLLRVQKRELEEKEREFIRIISTLRSKYNLAGQSEIRTLEGEEIKILLDDFSQSQTGEIIFAGKESLLKQWKEKLNDIKKRLGELDLKESKAEIPGAMIIYDKLVYLPSSEKAMLIENKEVIELIKAFI